MAELVFNGKSSEKDILERSKAIADNSDLVFGKGKSILIKGDNFNAMSLLMREYRGGLDLVYIDPPYNTSQNFTITDGKYNSMSRGKSGVVAYSDKMPRDDFFEFIRERLVLIRELLSDKGSIYLHIDCKVGHYIKILMDEVFGEECFRNDISRVKTNPKNFYRKAYGNEKDMILFYAKTDNNIWNDIRIPMTQEEQKKTFTKIDKDGRRYMTVSLNAPGETSGVTGQDWNSVKLPKGRHWCTDPKNFNSMDADGQIEWSSKGVPRLKKYADEYEGKRLQDIWTFKDPKNSIYPTEKNNKMLDQIIRQSSNEGSIVMDCFAGSGTTLESAERLGRKWIGVDSSDIAIKTIKSRNIGGYDYYEI